MLVQWRAVDVEGLSRWRTERELAIRDAEQLIEAGERGVVVVSRIATRPIRAKAATREAHARAARVQADRAQPRPVPKLVVADTERRDDR